jgi:hypothetical protein
MLHLLCSVLLAALPAAHAQERAEGGGADGGDLLEGLTAESGAQRVTLTDASKDVTLRAHPQ